MAAPIKQYGEELIKTWLIEPFDEKLGILNLHRIKSIPLLKELIAYDTNKGNFDRIMSLVCLMYLRQETRRIVVDKNKIPRNNFTQSDFWNKPHFNKSAYKTSRNLEHTLRETRFI